MFIDSLGDDVAQLQEHEYLEYNPGSELNIFPMNIKQWTLNLTK
jgi:hypothetical protein